MRILLFTFPLPPNRNRAKNSGSWAWNAAKKTWNANADVASMRKGFPRKPDTPYTSITVSAKLVMPAAMDEENAFYRASKCPMDWLKTRGYIVDDSRKVVTWRGLPEQLIGRKEPPRLEMTIVIEEAA